jgi:hypothetical protein
MFPSEEIDGLFCDETKKGIGVWRRSMGMEHEESLKIEVRPSMCEESGLIPIERDFWGLYRSQDIGGPAELDHEYLLSASYAWTGEGELNLALL